jgi:hypothetical protein
MARPHLLHPIPVWVRKIDKALTPLMDDALGEPIGQVFRPQKAVRLRAQIETSADARAEQSNGGIQLRYSGYLLFLTEDLRAARFKLEIGDRIVQVGEKPNDRATDWYVVSTEFLGHYQDQGGSTLVKAFYEDLAPSRLVRRRDIAI